MPHYRRGVQEFYDAPAGWSPPKPPPPIEVCSHGHIPLGLCLQQRMGKRTHVVRTERGFHAHTLLVEMMTVDEDEQATVSRSGIVLDRTSMTALRDLLDRAITDEG